MSPSSRIFDVASGAASVTLSGAASTLSSISSCPSSSPAARSVTSASKLSGSPNEFVSLAYGLQAGDNNFFGIGEIISPEL